MRVVQDDEECEWQLRQAMQGHSLAQLHECLNASDITWDVAIALLHVRGDPATFAHALKLASAQQASDRQVAARLLGQLGTPQRPFAQDSLPVLLELLCHDAEAAVRAEAACALGHLKLEAALPYLWAAALATDVAVRAMVAFALGQMPHEESRPVLLDLTFDPDIEVTYWAVLALGAAKVGCPEMAQRCLRACSKAAVLRRYFVENDFKMLMDFVSTPLFQPFSPRLALAR